MTPSPMTPTDIDALQKLLEKATKGDWKHWESRETVGVIEGTTFVRVCSEVEPDDGLLIAALHNAAASLLSEVKALREALRECGEHKEAPYGVTLIANAALGRSNTP